ncbi:MAG TPA: outer membrane protein assembly factor BamE [Planctomycetota bacterium]|nr:outer membrane protein assembly factor BamE [Planctomycetota bacterium]
MTFARCCGLAALLLLGACYFGRATVNEPLDPDALRTLRPGSTTAQQALELLGAPSDVVQLGKRSAWRYDHSVQKEAATWLLIFALLNTDQRQDRMWLFFDENDVLTHVGATFAAHRPQYAFPWEDVHEPEDAARRDADRFGPAR